MLRAYEFQRDFITSSVEQYGRDMESINVGCKQDPAGTGVLAPGMIQFDILEIDPITGFNQTTLPFFILGDAREMPFPDETFHLAVLGEFLEHCTEEMNAQVLSECARVLRPEGTLIVTYPFDVRHPTEQHPRNQLVEYCDAAATWHRMACTPEELPMPDSLTEVHQERLPYPWAQPTQHGYGLIYCKR